jgi:hypothetical protein
MGENKFEKQIVPEKLNAGTEKITKAFGEMIEEANNVDKRLKINFNERT